MVLLDCVCYLHPAGTVWKSEHTIHSLNFCSGYEESLLQGIQGAWGRHMWQQLAGVPGELRCVLMAHMPLEGSQRCCQGLSDHVSLPCLIGFVWFRVNHIRQEKAELRKGTCTDSLLNEDSGIQLFWKKIYTHKHTS